MSSVIIAATAVVVAAAIAICRYLEWCPFCFHVLAISPFGIVASVVVDVRVVVYAGVVVLLAVVDVVTVAVVAAVAAHARWRLLFLAF